jgi:hypothetical protein
MSVFRWFLNRKFWNRPTSHQVSLGSHIEACLYICTFMFLFSQIWLKGLWMIATHVTSHNWWKKKKKKKCSGHKNLARKSKCKSDHLYGAQFPSQSLRLLTGRICFADIFHSRFHFCPPYLVGLTLPPPSRYPRHLVHSCFFLQLKVTCRPHPPQAPIHQRCCFPPPMLHTDIPSVMKTKLF